MFIQQSAGKVQSGEQEVALFPRASSPLKTGVLYVHGAEGSNPSGMAWMSLSGRWGIMREVASRTPMLCPELGGNSTWGNDTALARMTASYNYLQTLPGVSPGKVSLLAQSMGGTTAVAWARANPSKVDRIAMLIPVINLLDVRDNSSYQAAIDAAYGGAYSEATYGATHNPLTIALAGGLAGIKVQLWYGATDTLCKPEFALQFAAALGSNCDARRMGGGHAEETVANVDAASIAQFLSPEI